jgi:hypothetical protein
MAGWQLVAADGYRAAGRLQMADGQTYLGK